MLHENVIFWRRQALPEEASLDERWAWGAIREAVRTQMGSCSVHFYVGIFSYSHFFFGILSQMKFYKQESRTNGLITGRVCATSNTCETILVAPALGPSAL